MAALDVQYAVLCQVAYPMPSYFNVLGLFVKLGGYMPSLSIHHYPLLEELASAMEFVE